MKRMKLQSLGLSVNDLLTREQLKSIYGGSGSGSGCKPACYKWNGSSMNSGTCSEKSTIVNGHKLIYCECSLSGGTGC